MVSSKFCQILFWIFALIFSVRFCCVKHVGRLLRLEANFPRNFSKIRILLPFDRFLSYFLKDNIARVSLKDKEIGFILHWISFSLGDWLMPMCSPLTNRRQKSKNIAIKTKFRSRFSVDFMGDKYDNQLWSTTQSSCYLEVCSV